MKKEVIGKNENKNNKKKVGDNTPGSKSSLNFNFVFKDFCFMICFLCFFFFSIDIQLRIPHS